MTLCGEGAVSCVGTAPVAIHGAAVGPLRLDQCAGLVLTLRPGTESRFFSGTRSPPVAGPLGAEALLIIFSGGSMNHRLVGLDVCVCVWFPRWGKV